MSYIERHDVEWRPSIIIGWRPGVTIACGPHETPFTANGFGWAYGRKIGDEFISFDLRTGRSLPIEQVLPGHSRFTIFADEEDGFELLGIERHTDAIAKANNAAICAQAMLANPVTIELGDWGLTGAPREIAKKIEWDDTNPDGAALVRRNDRPLTEGPAMRKSAAVYLRGLPDTKPWWLDLPRQILFTTPEVIPLIDCPAMTFDQGLRAQLKKAFPNKTGPWAIVAFTSSDHVIEASRQRETSHPAHPFFCEPHKRDLHTVAAPLVPFQGNMDLTIDGDQLVVDVGGWKLHATMKIERRQMKVHFGTQDWCELAWRPTFRNGIVAKIRNKFRTLYDIVLT